ncbi:MAG: rhodanese-like domain-containing protein [Tahibacter sp.]
MSEILQRIPDFFAHHQFLSLAFVGVLVAVIANEVSQFTKGYREVTPGELTMLINRENALLVDLSPQADFEKGHIPGARHVALAQFDPEHKDLVKVKDLPVAIVCKAGQNAGAAASRLHKAGFKRVYVLGGGTASWVAADLPLAKGKTG